MTTPITAAAPLGKRCTLCHCCDAVIEFAGEYLCAACDDGTHPPVSEQSKLTSKPISAAEALTPGKETKFMKRVITAEILKQIHTSNPSESCASIGKRLGISGAVVDYHRRKFRKESETPRAAGKPQEHPGRRKPKTFVQLKPNAVNCASANISVALDVTEETLNAWWMAQSAQTKAGIFAGNYVIRVEGIVR